MKVSLRLELMKVLNRKLSNYIFYFILIGIVAVVYLIRSIMLGGLIDRTKDLDNNNIILQAQIDNLEDIVQTNKDIQESHLYELYNQVPQTYSQTELTYVTIAKLELAGIDESNDFYREITLNSEVVLSGDTALIDAAENFKVVEVIVEFEPTEMAPIEDFLDLLNASEQLFVVNYIEFYTPNGVDSVLVTIHFLAFFEK